MTADGGRKGRRLSSEEIALWDGVARSVNPIRKPRRRVTGKPDKVVEAKPATKPVAAPKRIATAVIAPALPSPPKKAPSLVPLDRKTKHKIARGRDSIDGRLDLHGHTQAEAHVALMLFLRRVQARGGRMVLVITGKGGAGRAGSGDHDRGVLKRAVPLWLALPECRDLVIGFDSAAIPHGGEGALYVRLRKSRSD